MNFKSDVSFPERALDPPSQPSSRNEPQYRTEYTAWIRLMREYRRTYGAEKAAQLLKALAEAAK
jgi:hypothetical protein